MNNTINKEDLKKTVINYITTEFLGGSTEDDFDQNVLLISSGILDSVSTLQLVDFLEKQYNIEFSPHEVDQDNLNTVDLISDFVLSKIS